MNEQDRIQQLETQIRTLQSHRRFTQGIAMLTVLLVGTVFLLGAAQDPQPSQEERLRILESHFAKSGRVENLETKLSSVSKDINSLKSLTEFIKKKGGRVKLEAGNFHIQVGPYTWKFHGNGAAFRVGNDKGTKEITPISGS